MTFIQSWGSCVGQKSLDEKSDKYVFSQFCIIYKIFCFVIMSIGEVKYEEENISS